MFSVIIDLFQSIVGAFASGKTVEQYKKDKEQDKTKK
ncbi:hypothetical protein C5L23_001472 [Leuconostoc fallax]|uniref:Uncharacterized protein n=1 Tax=Leuconostoc fallax TaxID=1251 RepID=A0A4R5N7I8_9LACO|nr:hypothetical protein C5L23_001472 [Leuconostoc fallax]